MKLLSSARLLTAGLVLSGAALAQAQNDECANATTITADKPIGLNTLFATPSVPGFTASCSAAGGSTTSSDVWFKFTAPFDYEARATTCGTAGFDTKIEVYTGSCGALVSVACNDDAFGCPGFSSQVDFPVTFGTEYFIRVGGYSASDSGNADLLVTGPPVDVTNDECATALTIERDTPAAFDTTLATPSTPDFTASCSAGGGSTSSNDVWFRFTSDSSYPARVTTCNTAVYDTKIEVYDGSCGALVPVACNDDGDFCPIFTSQVDFFVASGIEYFVRIGGYSPADAGSGEVLLTDGPPPPPSIDNDDCATALPVGLGSTPFTSIGATNSQVDLSCVFNGEEADAWFSYTAIGDCPVTVDLSGSSYDTGMSVYSGDCAALTEVGCNDDGGIGLTSLVSFQATAGTTYYIQVGGFNGDRGDGFITLTEGIGAFVCEGNVNSTGVGAILRACGSDLVADNATTLEVTDLPANQNVLFVNSRETILVTNPGGSQGDLCIGSFALGRHLGAIANSGASGTAALGLNLANIPTNAGFTAVAAGETWYWQAWYRDLESSGAPTSNLSSAVGVTFN
ncbi:MAG: hypothetical protein VX015_08145 [Planctomycetota bacterium]|nr:hypothetical protein [Planctomycetota bacterium]